MLAGAGCDCDDYLVQAASQLHHDTGRRVTTTNRGVNGETAADLLQELRTDNKAMAEVKQADAIVLTVGANDLQSSLDTWSDKGCNSSCYQPEIASMADRLDSILTIIDRAKKPGAVVLVTNYWNVYLDGDVGKHTYGAGYLSWSDTVTRAANTAICRSATQAKATCVDLYQPFKGDGGDDPTELLADDGDHANARGTTTIARVVAKDIIAGQPVQWPYLGIGLDGVRVTNVDANSGAGKAGLQAGDIITAVEGQPVTADTPLSTVLLNFSVGQTVKVEIQRNGQPLTLEITLGARPATAG